jgi:hypothetical protein
VIKRTLVPSWLHRANVGEHFQRRDVFNRNDISGNCPSSAADPDPGLDSSRLIENRIIRFC